MNWCQTCCPWALRDNGKCNPDAEAKVAEGRPIASHRWDPRGEFDLNVGRMQWSLEMMREEAGVVPRNQNWGFVPS